MSHVTREEVVCKSCGRILRKYELQYDSPVGRICLNCYPWKQSSQTTRAREKEKITSESRGILGAPAVKTLKKVGEWYWRRDDIVQGTIIALLVIFSYVLSGAIFGMMSIVANSLDVWYFHVLAVSYAVFGSFILYVVYKIYGGLNDSDRNVLIGFSFIPLLFWAFVLIMCCMLYWQISLLLLSVGIVLVVWKLTKEPPEKIMKKAIEVIVGVIGVIIIATIFALPELLMDLLG